MDAQPKAPLAKGGCLGNAEAGGFRRQSLRNFLPIPSSLFPKKPSPFHMGSYFGKVPPVESLSQKSKIFASSLWQGSLCGQCPRTIPHGSFRRFVTSLTRPPGCPRWQCARWLCAARFFPDPPGIVTAVQMDAQPKAPLAKGGCLGNAEAGGFRRQSLRNFLPIPSSLFTKKPFPFHIGLLQVGKCQL